eukprot:7386466-Prymnesium_polylepis.3
MAVLGLRVRERACADHPVRCSASGCARPAASLLGFLAAQYHESERPEPVGTGVWSGIRSARGTLVPGISSR